LIRFFAFFAAACKVHDPAVAYRLALIKVLRAYLAMEGT
jgi:hypothetical protein